jgi:hypothetical protein
VPGRFLDRLSHLIVAVKVEDVGDQVQRVLVVLDLSVEAGEVEPVGQVVLIDLAEVLVSTRRNKLAPESACENQRHHDTMLA